jgi:D-beta-D-heptose 7-phosphate kinase/D-beta-D-heptose 1-phosphate adenosyltransferase
MKNTEKSSKIVKNILSGGIKLTDRFISDKADLSAVVKTLKQAGYRIVLTQGVYDMFHVGHKRYLESAKSHGDILIVGIDSDELTRKMKGPKRPFDKLEDRLEILAGLKVVDIVTVRHVDEPMYGLIKLVRPDVLVMSQTTSTFSDKDKKNLLPYCGTIQTLPAQASTTTTAKLQRM